MGVLFGCNARPLGDLGRLLGFGNVHVDHASELPKLVVFEMAWTMAPFLIATIWRM